MIKWSLFFFMICLNTFNIRAEQDFRELYNDAIEKINLKQYSEAELLLRKVTDINPNYFFAWYNLGMVLFEQKCFKESVEAFENAIKLDPKHYQTLFFLGKIYEISGDYNKAMDYYFNCLSIMSNAELFRRLASINVKLNNLTAATSLYKRSLNLEDNFIAWFGLGNAQRLLKDNGGAIESYKKASLLKPDNWQIYMNLALTLSMVSKYKEAIDYYRKVVELNPDYPEAWYNMANGYRCIDDYTNALFAYHKAIEKRSNFKEAVYNLACCYAFLKDRNNSLKWLKEAVSLDPSLKNKAREDKDFVIFRRDPNFKKIIK